GHPLEPELGQCVGVGRVGHYHRIDLGLDHLAALGTGVDRQHGLALLDEVVGDGAAELPETDDCKITTHVVPFYPTMIRVSGYEIAAGEARLRANASVSGPTRPTNIVAMITALPVTLRLGVTPRESPTVPSALMTSKARTSNGASSVTSSTNRPSEALI